MTNLSLVAVCLGVVVLPACNRSSDRTASDPVVAEHREPGMRPASRASSAAESIAEARCARENRCDNVGADKKFSSTSDCLARVRNDWKDDLNARECPGGVNESELQDCLGAIRAEECNSPIDTLDRVTECTASAICVD
jgi:hypothetical protein